MQSLAMSNQQSNVLILIKVPSLLLQAEKKTINLCPIYFKLTFE